MLSKKSKKRPDMVIAKVDFKKDEHTGYYGEDIEECIAVIEIKFKNANCADSIYKDYEKLETYIKDLNINAHLFMVTIWEAFDSPTTWARKNASWAKGRLTELNASYKKGTDNEIQFYFFEH